MDFTDLKANTLDRTGLPSTDGLAQTTTLGLAVNHAIQMIAGWRPWPWLYSEETANTVAGTNTLALPVPAYRVTSVTIDDDVLDRRQRTDLARFFAAAGRPNRWAMIGSDSIVLAPSPNDVYTVTFGLILVEPSLTGGTDTPLLPVQFHDLIVVLAARYLAVRRKDTTAVQMLDDEIKEWREALDRAAIIANGSFPVRSRQDWTL